ncbi:MAG: glycosyltransferase, partial [Halanaerobiales bacterium]|nr:glycosyltransferase [Halanaerobiales bacterium]
LRKKYGDKKVDILYSIKRKEIIKLTKKCSFCFMTSNYEYYPITIVEAMASKKAFLSTNVGIVNKLPGGIVVSKKKDLIYWLEHLTSTKLYKKLGTIGFEYANNNLTNQSQINKLLEILK